MPSKQIQWFPGHMAKTRRLISENLKNVDIIIEILDARIPRSSKNPEISTWTKGKPTLTLLNKASLADPAITAKWVWWYKKSGADALPIDCITGEGLSKIGPQVREILADKISRFQEKGMTGRKLRAMIVGIPNVGKSSLVNKLCGQKKARVEDRPGVTLNKQWVTTTAGFDLLDMPGVLWPKFEDQLTGENLAATGAIKDAILDTDELGMILSARLLSLYPEKFCTRYKLDYERVCQLDSYDLLEEIGRKRGFLISGGEINLERTALTVLDEFRGVKIGRISLESPAENSVAHA
ncbi:MAG: ribosome biogenesis GTPase YlqF [Clostridiales bacterium]|jgi:ribosome biogenesis GTPase A|nr:ribosome biogenesis GTPase YlqF [Clostridiales bacterium]